MARLAPVALLGSGVGLKVGARFPKRRVRQLAFVLLLLIALRSMLPRLLRLAATHHSPAVSSRL